MSQPEFLAKGTHVLQASQWIDSKLGAGTFRDLAAKAGVDWSSLLPMHWYDLDVLLTIIAAAAQRLDLSVEEATMEIAQRNAKHDLTTVYRIFLRIVRPVRVLSFMPRMWETYFKFGTVQVVKNEPREFTLVTTGIPERFLGWLRGGWQGFLPETIKVAGGQDVKLSLDTPAPDGAPGMYRVQVRAAYRV